MVKSILLVVLSIFATSASNISLMQLMFQRARPAYPLTQNSSSLTIWKHCLVRTVLLHHRSWKSTSLPMICQCLPQWRALLWSWPMPSPMTIPQTLMLVLSSPNILEHPWRKSTFTISQESLSKKLTNTLRISLKEWNSSAFMETDKKCKKCIKCSSNTKAGY